MSTRAELNAASQVVHPWVATLRTAVQVALPALLTLVVVVPAVIEVVLAEFGETMPPALRLWLLGAAGFITALAVTLTRIMAIPAVNAWLSKLGLAATV